MPGQRLWIPALFNDVGECISHLASAGRTRNERWLRAGLLSASQVTGFPVWSFLARQAGR